MSHPNRIRRSRESGWRKPSGAVIATRPGPFGNPFRDRTPAENVADFRSWLLGETHKSLLAERRREILRKLPHLRGKQVACFCGLDDPCHVDILCELANRPRCVEQTTLTNCFRACVATVFNTLIELVPEECEAPKWDFAVFQRWLFREYRLQAVEITLNKSAVIGPILQGQILVILTIPSSEPTTGLHCVVAATAPDDRLGFEVLWDPHPAKSPIGDEIVSAMYFVPVSPLVDIAEISDCSGIRNV